MTKLLVNLDVGNLEEAIRFYNSAFGLKAGRRLGAFGVEMLGGPAPIYLLLKPAGTPASPAASQHRSYERHWTPVHLRRFPLLRSDLPRRSGRRLSLRQ
jgi:catechol 2,3-dioxygenase-like lactoylglutathione lyase family enzyme